MHVNFGVYSGGFDLDTYAPFAAALISIFMAIAGFGASGGSRAVLAVVGLAALAYGSYLAFFYDCGTYWISVYVFAVPILAIVNAVRSRKPEATPPPNS